MSRGSVLEDHNTQLRKTKLNARNLIMGINLIVAVAQIDEDSKVNLFTKVITTYLIKRITCKTSLLHPVAGGARKRINPDLIRRLANDTIRISKLRFTFEFERLFNL